MARMSLKVQWNRNEFAGGSEMGNAVELGWVVASNMRLERDNGRYPFYSRSEMKMLKAELRELHNDKQKP